MENWLKKECIPPARNRTGVVSLTETPWTETPLPREQNHRQIKKHYLDAT